MKFVDDRNKKLKWNTRNYFWVVSIVYVALNILLFVFLGKKNLLKGLESQDWRFFDVVREWLVAIGNTFSHSSYEHVLQNMLGLFVCAFYMERKMGSFKFFVTLLCISLFNAVACSFAAGGLNWSGNSGVWFALVGYVLIDYLFSLRKSERNLTNLIVGFIVLALEWFRLGFYDQLGGGIGWVCFPYQLIMQRPHLIGFIFGALLALTICVMQNKPQRIFEQNIHDSKACSRFSRFALVIILVVFAWLPVYLYGQSKREYIIKFEVDCNVNKYDCEFTIDDMGVTNCTSGDVVDFWIKYFNLSYDQSELNVEFYDVINDIHFGKGSWFRKSKGNPSYWDPVGTGDYIGGHYVFTIMLPE